MSIESKHFVASAADIEALTNDILTADDTLTSGRGTYLKAIIAKVQSELGSEPRMRNAAATKKLDEDGIREHLAALKKVYGEYHAIVLRTVRGHMTKYDPAFVRSKTRFSVSAASTVRSYIRAGNDLRSLAAGRVTKEGLATPRARRKFTVEALQKRAAALAELLASVAKNLQAANRELAKDAIRPILAELATAVGLTENATRDVDKAVHDGIALHTRTGVLVPIDLAAVRQRKKAA